VKKRFSEEQIVGILREALAIEVGHRLQGKDVVRACNQLIESRGAPVRIIVDNSSEFSGKLFDLWAYHHKVHIEFSGQDSPPSTVLSNHSMAHCGTSV
jgi:hypothetical protein